MKKNFKFNNMKAAHQDLNTSFFYLSSDDFLQESFLDCLHDRNEI